MSALRDGVCSEVNGSNPNINLGCLSLENSLCDVWKNYVISLYIDHDRVLRILIDTMMLVQCG